MEGQKVVQLPQLSLPQLEHLKNQIEEEVNMLSTSMAQLKMVQQKLNDSRIAVNSLKPDSEGKEILVPLSTSMYVPGKVSKGQTFICDIGTGYYLEKDQKQAAEFFQRRMDYVTANLEKLQGNLMEKYKIGENIVGLMQAKLHAQIQKSKS